MLATGLKLHGSQIKCPPVARGRRASTPDAERTLRRQRDIIQSFVDVYRKNARAPPHARSSSAAARRSVSATP